VNQILSEFEKTIEKFPDCVETYALSAQVLNDQQEFARADELYKKAMTKDPQNANLLVHRYTTQKTDKGLKQVKFYLILDFVLQVFPYFY